MLRSERTQKRIKLTPAQKDAIYALPLSLQFCMVYLHPESGFAVYQHMLVDCEASDYEQILAVAKAYAAETDCWINPEVDRHAVEARKMLFSDLPVHLSRSNPDLTTRTYGYIDVKSPLNKSNIVSNANHAYKQGAIAVLTDLALEKEEISLEELNKFTERIFSEHNRNHLGEHNYTRHEVHWFIKGELIKCNRPGKN